MFYERHIFVCVNQKDNGKKCCAEGGSPEFATYLKERLVEKGLHGPGKNRVTTTKCLGRCSIGPSLVIYPEGVWYNFSTESDLDRIIDEHISQNKVIETLKIAD